MTRECPAVFRTEQLYTQKSPIYLRNCWFCGKDLNFSFKGHLAGIYWGCVGYEPSVLFSSVQSLSQVQLFAIPWIAAHWASLSITNSQSSLRLMSIESVMPSSHLILCHPLLLLPPIPPRIRVFFNESTLCMRWPKYWSRVPLPSPGPTHKNPNSVGLKWTFLQSFPCEPKD